MHTFTGRDIIEKFSGNSKQTWVKAFLEAEENTVEAFTSYTHNLTTNFGRELERFICNVYVPKVNFSNVKDVRWNRFKINSSNISLLPPSHGALHQHTLRSYWQANIWINAMKSHPSNLYPANYGWNLDNGEYDRVMNESPIALSNI